MTEFESTGKTPIAGADSLLQPRSVHCHACGAEILLGAGERIALRAECESCSADLHVCCNCAHHDASAYNECRESSAERVLDKERANACDYFRAGDGRAHREGRSGAREALAQLFRK
ncbi:MAG: hypothetical protein OEM49_08920 [Myxococcales bacterium]|nr:hypothetical protein [Myxococcales bacterium]MDH5306596.1 hypothetical protein [Myxococcales bacterium]